MRLIKGGISPGDLELPLMRRGMGRLGEKMLAAQKKGGEALAMVATMQGGIGELVDVETMALSSRTTLDTFMQTTRSRIQARIAAGNAVVVVGISVMLEPKDKGAEGEQKGPVRGAAVFAVNRKETAAEVYVEDREKAVRMKREVGPSVTVMLTQVIRSLFAGLRWPVLQ
ncbi:MAG: hypothetical protein GY769_08005 [bacterium]|nr:hypothetical protein [bacterium]